MFIAGNKKYIIKSTISNDLVCPKCNEIKTTKVSIIGTYKHLLHIPFFSGNKSGISICNNCNTKHSIKNMPAAIKLAYFELKETTKTPFWFFTGLFLIKTLVLIKIFSKYF